MTFPFFAPAANIPALSHSNVTIAPTILDRGAGRVYTIFNKLNIRERESMVK
jgi:hypothetical protein